MALNTCELWFNGITIASFFTKNCTAAGSLTSRPSPEPRLWWGWVTLVYSAHLPIYTFALFICGLSPLPMAKSWLRANTLVTASDLPSTISLSHKKFLFQKFLKTPLHVIWSPPQSKILATPMPLVVHALLQLVSCMTKQISLRDFFEWIIIYH